VIDRQNIFKENVFERLSGNNIFKYTVPYSSADFKIHEAGTYTQKAPVEVLNQEYLDKFASDVYAVLSTPFTEMLSKPPASALQMDADAHGNLMKRNAALIFRHENDAVFRDIVDYIHGSPSRAANLEKATTGDAKSRKRAKDELEKQPLPNTPLIIIGPPGAGKTALLAHVAEKFSYSKEAGHSALIYRSVGSTPLSADGRLLLDGLCEELARLYGSARSGPRPPSYNSLLVEFGELLRMLSNKKTVLLFLDGLDQLPRYVSVYVCVCLCSCMGFLVWICLRM
jgi:hypothetical protein